MYENGNLNLHEKNVFENEKYHMNIDFRFGGLDKSKQGEVSRMAHVLALTVVPFIATESIESVS